jgi:hypothetical protein
MACAKHWLCDYIIQENYKMKKGSSTIGIQIIYNMFGNPFKNHTVVFRLIQCSLLDIMLLGPKT